jgi:hypothetical protein
MRVAAAATTTTTIDVGRAADVVTVRTQCVWRISNGIELNEWKKV